jgi:TusA-related sulfurtransferase
MSGWIKIHRQILDWEWFDDKNAFRLFMYLLLKANHKERSYKGKIIKVGETLTGLELLSKELGLTVQQTRTALSKLKSTNEITIKTSTQGTVIQVVNYSKYQTSTNEITDEQQTNNKRITTNKNDKKENNENIPTKDEFIAYALSVMPDVSLTDLNLKYQSWVVNDWCINRNGNLAKILNWKSTLTNTLKYLDKEPIKVNGTPIYKAPWQ